MRKITVYIDDYSHYSYKLNANEIHHYHERALEEAKNLYLKIYDKNYRNLMGFDFNPLWTPDTKSENDLDFKDDFGDVSYFYFNICLLRILSNEYQLRVVDRTSSPFSSQKFIHAFLKERGIEIEKIFKPRRVISKHKIKKFVFNTLKKTPGKFANKLRELRKIITLEEQVIESGEGRKVIYLYVHSVGGMTLQSYLDWRYSELLTMLNKEEYKIIIVSTIDFKDSGSVGHEFINVNKLVSKGELFNLFFKSIFIKAKVLGFKWFHVFKRGLSTEEFFFVKNLPGSFFYTLRELAGLENLFNMKGPGLLIISGPLNNKGASSLFYKARRCGVRVHLIAPRILTSTRFSNQFINAHFEDKYPPVFPHSMTVFDKISFATIRKQTEEICLYPIATDNNTNASLSSPLHVPFAVTLVLQKKKEIEDMTDQVLKAIEKLNDVILNLKMHPSFPLTKTLSKKYSQVSNLNILPRDTSLEEAVQMSDICVTSYSTAALDFIKAGKPVVWQKTVTVNSLFFSELQKQVGLSVDSPEELRDIISKMKNSNQYYSEERKTQYEQYQKIIYDSNADGYNSISNVLRQEMQKI